jgi:hypothetical protein
MAPIYSKLIANTSRFTGVEVKLMDLCKDYIDCCSVIDVDRLAELKIGEKKVGDKPFEHTSMDQRQLILDEIAYHYNSKVLDGTVLACHLVRGNRDSESSLRWKCRIGGVVTLPQRQHQQTAASRGHSSMMNKRI